MGGAPHPGIAGGTAGFHLDRLELVDGRLVVRGWWSGVRGVRFVRPELVVDGQRVLATLEHKPWAADADGAWIAAFPWKRGLGVGGVMLVVGPSVEVPLDRELVEPEVDRPARRRAVAPRDRVRAPGKSAKVRGRAEVGEVERQAVPAAAATVVEELYPPLRAALEGVEQRLDALHAELREDRTQAAEREARYRELEHVVARERRAAPKAEETDEDFVRAHAMAVLDRDRALAQAAAAVDDREAAVHARERMELQREEAIAARESAEARRDEALAERDEARKQRDEMLLAIDALKAQLAGEWTATERAEATSRTSRAERDTEALRTVRRGPATKRGRGNGIRGDEQPRGVRGDEEPLDVLRAAQPGGVRGDEEPKGVLRAAQPGGVRGDEERKGVLRAAQPSGVRRVAEPIGVRRIPAARTIAGSLHHAGRERERRTDHGVTSFELWAFRVFGSIAALSFVSLLVMILKAFFAF